MELDGIGQDFENYFGLWSSSQGKRLWWDTQSLKSVTDSHPSDPRLSVQNVQVDLQMEEEQGVQ